MYALRSLSNAIEALGQNAAHKRQETQDPLLIRMPPMRDIASVGQSESQTLLAFPRIKSLNQTLSVRW